MSNQMADVFSVVISIINSPAFITSLKLIFITIGIALFIGIIFFLFRNNWLKNRFLENAVEIVSYRPFGVKKTFKQWAKLIKKMEKGKDSDHKMVVIEADSILNDVLQKMGYKGETTKELLEQIDSKILPNIENIWKAHKMRNTVIHEPDYKLTLEETKKILDIYEQAFRYLEMF